MLHQPTNEWKFTLTWQEISLKMSQVKINWIMTTRLNIRHETFFNSFVSFVADKEVLIWMLIEICLGYHREVPTFKSSNSELHVLNRWFLSDSNIRTSADIFYVDDVSGCGQSWNFENNDCRRGKYLLPIRPWAAGRWRRMVFIEIWQIGSWR